MSLDEKQISLRQVIDLIQAGPETSARIGQYPQIWERMPDLCAELETIAAKLDGLGLNGWGILRRYSRLRKVFDYYACWKDIQTHGHDTSAQPISFTIDTAQVRRQAAAMTQIMKRMARMSRTIELRLKDQSLLASCGDLAFSLPTQHEEEGTVIVKRGFIKILLDALTKDKLIKCRLDGIVYEINGVTYKPSNMSTE